MARKKLPWFRFYPGDYLNDPAMRMLNYEQKGVWVELICVAARSPIPGALLLDNGDKISKEYVVEALITPYCLQKTSEYAQKILETLISLGLLREGIDGTIYSRHRLFDRSEWDDRNLRNKAAFNEWLAPRRQITGEDGLPQEFRKTFKTRPAKLAAKPAKTAEASAEAVSLTNLLIAEMLRNLPTSKVPAESNGAFTVWAAEIDRMVNLDRRDPKEIEKIILFSQRDNFWKKNIRSTAKLRMQFEQLQLKMRDDTAEWKKPKETEEERMIRAMREGIK